MRRKNLPKVKPATISKETHIAIRLLKKLFDLRIAHIFLAIIFVLIVVPTVIFFVLRPKVQSQINYGTTFSPRYATEIGLNWKDAYIKILDDLGVKNLRIVAYWDLIEKEQGKYNFSEVKWQLDEAQKRGAKVIMTIGRKVPRFPECFEPAWWKSMSATSEKSEQLYKYVQTAVNELKYSNAITMWQVENEPFFPFGDCERSKMDVVSKEVSLVRAIDPRPILIQDSGEGGFWFVTYRLGDKLGISMYRKIWYDFWGIFFGRFIYFQYPLAHWSYKIKADFFGVPYQNIYVTELQAEPWGPRINSELSQEDIDKTMSKHLFLDTINYAQKAGFKDLYLWGVEWWIFEKEIKGNSYYYDTAKALFR